MSVINQVLNDIEQRKNNDLALDTNKFSALELKEPRSKAAISAALLIVAGVLIAVIWWQYDNWSGSSVNKQQTKPYQASQAVKTEPVAAAEPSAAIKHQPSAVIKNPLSPAIQHPPPATKTNPRVASEPDDIAERAADSNPGPTLKLPAVAVEATTSANKTSTTVRTVATQPQQSSDKPPIKSEHSGIALKKAKVKALSIEPVKLTPDEIAALKFKQGIEQQRQGDPFKAQDSWRESLQLVPDYHQAREHLALSYIDLNNTAQALAILIEGIDKFPSREQYQLLAAKIYLHQQQPQQALFILDRPHRFTDKSSELVALAAAIAQQLQKWQQAELNYGALVGRDKSNEKWLMGLAIALDAQAKAEPAMSRYSQMISLPDVSPVLADYARRRIVQLKAQQQELLEDRQQRENNG